MDINNQQGFIKPSFIEELQDRAVLSDIIGRYVKLENAGARKYKGCCPFHHEKTPSFYIDDERSVYHCFGCGAKGNVLSFLRDYNGLNFKDAVVELANLVGLPVEYEADHRSNQDKEREQQRKQSLQLDHQILQEVAQFYQHQLFHSQHAVDYLVNRGMSQEMAQLYCLGYAPANNAILHYYNSQVAQGLNQIPDPLTHLLNVDILRRSSQKEGFYDTYRERIIFPIFNLNGQIVGFGGRILTNEKDKAKYINPSNNSTVYDKSKELYGLYQVVQIHRQNRQKIPRIILVEGYLDVISLSQYGIYQGVAASGTAISQGQLAQIFKHTQSLVCCFDGDAAGYKAAVQAAKNVLGILTDQYMVQFAFLTDGEDPDSYLKKYGPQAYDQFLQTKSIGLIDYLIDHTLSSLQSQQVSEHDLERLALKQLGEYYAQIQAQAYRNDLVNKLIRRFELDYQALMAQLAQVQQTYQQEQTLEQQRLTQFNLRQQELKARTERSSTPTRSPAPSKGIGGSRAGVTTTGQNQRTNQEPEQIFKHSVQNTSVAPNSPSASSSTQNSLPASVPQASTQAPVVKTNLGASGYQPRAPRERKSKTEPSLADLRSVRTYEQANRNNPLNNRVLRLQQKLNEQAKNKHLKKQIERSVQESTNTEYTISYEHAFRELLANAYSQEEKQAQGAVLNQQLWEKLQDQAVQNLNYRLRLQRTAIANGRKIREPLEFNQESVKQEMLRIAKHMYAQSIAYNVPLPEILAQPQTKVLPQAKQEETNEFPIYPEQLLTKIAPLEREQIQNKLTQIKLKFATRFAYDKISFHNLTVDLEHLLFADSSRFTLVSNYYEFARRFENRLITLLSWYYHRPLVAIHSMLSYITVFNLPGFTCFNHLHFALSQIRDQERDGELTASQVEEKVPQVVKKYYQQYLQNYFGDFEDNLVNFDPEDAPYIFNKGMQETYTNLVTSICRLCQLFVQSFADNINNANVEMTYLRSLEQLLQQDLRRLQHQTLHNNEVEQANLKRAQQFLHDYDKLHMQQYSYLISFINPPNPQPMPGYDLIHLGKFSAPLWSSLHPEIDMFEINSMLISAFRVEDLREKEKMRRLKIQEQNEYQATLKSTRESQGFTNAQALEHHDPSEVEISLTQVKEDFAQTTKGLGQELLIASPTLEAQKTESVKLEEQSSSAELLVEKALNSLKEQASASQTTSSQTPASEQALAEVNSKKVNVTEAKPEKATLDEPMPNIAEASLSASELAWQAQASLLAESQFTEQELCAFAPETEPPADILYSPEELEQYLHEQMQQETPTESHPEFYK
ncbi:DNA primase [Psittacicella gerlachiana]|uniref:DNA primase n=1 Tax=Psittacicella gerlachiana TaxID=2028574 RepID=A0A3A1YDL8_9GAMM|nr:DNA primase [Psittacicella gerlachiana]RIY35290.1 DNA primase [Psittacicella gerlachiana]